ncbi:anti-sigma factor antagonist [bacterium]|nr:anti-sigma factor antagonist [bacterium]
MLKTSVRGDVVVLQLGGIVNVKNTRDIWRRIEDLLSDASVRAVALDMSGVLMLDSSGLGLLVRMEKTLHQRGAELCLAGVSSPVAELLELTRLDGFFDITASTDEAVELLQETLSERNAPATESEMAAQNGNGDRGTLVAEFRTFMRSINPSVSEEEVTKLTGALEQLEDFEQMMALLVDAYDRDLHAKAEEIASKRISVIREVAIGLNHEINNPLTVILASSELLERRLTGIVEDKVIERLRAIQLQCDRIKDIVSKVAAIVKPVSSEYYCGMKMIDVHKSN